MNREAAEEILESLAWMGFPTEMLFNSARNLPDGSERDQIMECLKQILGAQSDLMIYIAKKYPDMDPIGEGEERFYQSMLKYQTAEFPARRMSADEIESAEKAGLEAAREIRREMKGE